jgi:hypothetical protein
MPPCRCVPPAEKLPWVEDLKGDMDADYGSGICSVLNKRVLTPFPFRVLTPFSFHGMDQ